MTKTLQHLHADHNRNIAQGTCRREREPLGAVLLRLRAVTLSRHNEPSPSQENERCEAALISRFILREFHFPLKTIAVVHVNESNRVIQ